jgi:hypothetical protein
MIHDRLVTVADHPLNQRGELAQAFLEFLPIQKFASVNMVAVKQQIEAA